MTATELVLSVEHLADVTDPSWAAVADALTNLSERNAFVILGQVDGDYVQALGRPDKLTVQYGRPVTPDAFARHVLGRRGATLSDHIMKILGSHSEQVICFYPVFRREVLDLTDALVIFECFYRTLKAPDAYALREITNQDSAMEQYKFENPDFVPREGDENHH